MLFSDVSNSLLEAVFSDKTILTQLMCQRIFAASLCFVLHWVVGAFAPMAQLQLPGRAQWHPKADRLYKLSEFARWQHKPPIRIKRNTIGRAPRDTTFYVRWGFHHTVHSDGSMHVYLHGLYMQSRKVSTHRGHDPGFLEENAIIGVSKCMFDHRRLLRLPQKTTAAVFIDVGSPAQRRKYKNKIKYKNENRYKQTNYPYKHTHISNTHANISLF